MNPKSIIGYLTYLYPHRKTKWGLFVASILIVFLYIQYVLPKYFINDSEFYIFSIIFLVIWTSIIILWLLYSGRIIASKKPFTVIFCLKSSDAMSTKYLQNSMHILKTELDKLGLLQTLRIRQIGQDIIHNNHQAIAYRDKYDVDLIIWGEIFCGAKSEKQVCDFKNMFFTCQIPPNLIVANLSELFKNDINIALINRDWNIFEINSLPDTEKISANLSEVIIFILGLIYAQRQEFAEKSGVILEALLNSLTTKTREDKILLDDVNKQIEISPEMLRKGRIHDILLNLYKNLGIYFVEHEEYTKGIKYLNKCIELGGKNIDTLSSAALATYYLKDIDAAKDYTNKISEIERYHPIYILNCAFFSVNENNYSSALFYYKQILKRGRNIDKAIIIRVIAFLDERKSEYPKEIAYDFAIGILNKYHLQEKEGDKELRRFVKTAKNKEQYREMVCFVENDVLNRRKRRGKHR